ncbi:hypothetical protein ORV05_26280 [Amycolatopsis cynarae]|uniref:Uncharacterized protein n=1 Tax=Amycolatopsis cynarae TaxID=2995223 RepID=A0ABY7AXK4_9PSEU|nr:hypothetical protein [Amycolatopsis sp. HUAS 11-8]WAL64454.1 hypothetical protein ORV05_26280 [Amycolatopsis sp. HUAS 11-8]
MGWFSKKPEPAQVWAQEQEQNRAQRKAANDRVVAKQRRDAEAFVAKHGPVEAKKLSKSLDDTIKPSNTPYNPDALWDAANRADGGSSEWVCR